MILETGETKSIGVADYRDGASLTQRRKRERLILDSELMNLPDLHAYAKVPNNSFITVSRFTIKDYPAKTNSFMIRENLVLDTLIKDQPAIDKTTPEFGFGADIQT